MGSVTQRRLCCRLAGMVEREDAFIWREEFAGEAGASLSPAVWSAEVGGGGWGCGQRQTYTPDEANAQIRAGGQLAITALRAADPAGSITSARLITKDRISVRYGRIEARMKVPGGRGTWPAFWMLGSNIDQVGWPACGEIDVMEHVGSDPGTVHGTLHAPGYCGLDGGLGRAHRPGDALVGEFHIYGVDWSEDSIVWLFDGDPYFRLTPSEVPGAVWPFNQPFYLLLNLAVGGAWPGNDTPPFDLPATLLIDWIRIAPNQSTPQPMRSP